jgi:Ca-activated chloride channel family protein
MVVGYSDEMRIRPTDEQLLRKVADMTGGTFDPDPAALFRDDDLSAERSARLWPHLVALAAALLAVDVALRRVDFSLHWPMRRAIGR